ncbi:TOBE domain-containing protein, partial [Mycobacterium tuberculosis]|nr:TOBE domain-containing protein [Mycobacterium tuberculosis]
ATYRLPLGTVTAPTRDGLAAGTRATLALRPEAAALAPLDADTAGWPGTVKARYYAGSLIDYRVKLDCGVEVHVQTLPS